MSEETEELLENKQLYEVEGARHRAIPVPVLLHGQTGWHQQVKILSVQVRENL